MCLWARPWVANSCGFDLSLPSDKLAVDVGLRRACRSSRPGDEGHSLSFCAIRRRSCSGPSTRARTRAHASTSRFSLVHGTAATSTSAWPTRNTATQPHKSRSADYRRAKGAGNKEALAAARAVRRRLLWLLESHAPSPDRYLLVSRVRQNKTEVRRAAFTCGGMSSFGLQFVLRRRRHVLTKHRSAGRRRADRRGLGSWTNLAESVDRASVWIVNVAFSWALFGNEACWRHGRSGRPGERDDVTAARSSGTRSAEKRNKEFSGHIMRVASLIVSTLLSTKNQLQNSELGK